MPYWPALFSVNVTSTVICAGYPVHPLGQPGLPAAPLASPFGLTSWSVTPTSWLLWISGPT